MVAKAGAFHVPRVFFYTEGCAKNEVDTDVMRSRLLHAGFSEAFRAEDAEVLVVNTCSFLASAVEASIVTTLDLASEYSGIPLIMCGCVPSRYGDDLFAELPEVAAFLPVDQEDHIVETVCKVLSIDPPENDVLAFHGPLRSRFAGAAYIKISDGCNRRCSFCAIPFIRGPYHSRSLEEICSEAAALFQAGVKEIVLIGQDTGVWGLDFAEKSSLAHLLAVLGELARPYQAWIRVLYLQPDGMTDELIAAIRDIPEVLPYIDIPIQHCNQRVLKAMGRSGSAESLRELFSRLKQEIPSITLRTTALCGFPTESEAEAAEMVDFIDEIGFDYCSVFMYSREEGTRSATMKGQIPEKTKVLRAQRLQDTAERLGFLATASHVGEMCEVIIDAMDEADGITEFIGHAAFQAPDSDGAVHIPYCDSVKIGDRVSVRLTESVCYELTGELVKEGRSQ